MKHILVIILVCLQITIARSQQILNIDLKNSQLVWTGHAEIGTYAPEGKIELESGKLLVKGDSIVSSLIIMDMKTMQQSNKDLLAHLKSPDFFDVEKYGTSTIKISKISNRLATGMLTIKDKTLPFACPVSIQKIFSKYIITGKVIIDRTKFGIVYNSGSFFSNLGDHAIRNTFDVEFKIVSN